MYRYIFVQRLSLALLLASGSTMCLGQAPPAAAAAPLIDSDEVFVEDLSGRLDLSIPQSSAFTLLGVSPDKVVQADNFRTAATSLLRGIDANGNLQEGIAIDVRPYMLLAGRNSRLSDYREHRWVQIVSRSKLSFATASGSDDSDRADRQALGLNIVFWMQSDPALGEGTLEYTDSNGTPVKVPERGAMSSADFKAAAKNAKATLNDCYVNYLNAASRLPLTLPTDDEIPAAEENIAQKSRAATTKCLAPYKEQHWNAGSLELAVAGHRSKVGAIDENGFGAWFGASYGIGKRGQVIGRVSYSEDLLVPVKNQPGQYDIVDERNAGMRLRYGTARGAFMLEGLWTRSHSAASDEKYWRGSIGAELEIMRDVWVQLAIGKAFNTNRFDDDPVYTGQLRFGFSYQSLFSGKK